MKITFQEPYKSITEEDKEDLESDRVSIFYCYHGKERKRKNTFSGSN